MSDYTIRLHHPRNNDVHSGIPTVTATNAFGAVHSLSGETYAKKVWLTYRGPQVAAEYYPAIPPRELVYVPLAGTSHDRAFTSRGRWPTIHDGTDFVSPGRHRGDLWPYINAGYYWPTRDLMGLLVDSMRDATAHPFFPAVDWRGHVYEVNNLYGVHDTLLRRRDAVVDYLMSALEPEFTLTGRPGTGLARGGSLEAICHIGGGRVNPPLPLGQPRAIAVAVPA